MGSDKNTKTVGKVKQDTTPDVAVPTVDPDAPLKVEDVEEQEDEEPQEKSNSKLFILGGVVLGIVIISSAALLIFSLTQPTQDTKEVKTEATSEPSQAPKIALNRQDWSIEVLNGSGVAGVAKKTADQLIELGYQVIEVGNADKQTYKSNQLFVSQKMEDKADLLIADLKDTISIATVAGELKDSTASARIIIGAGGSTP